MWWVFLLDNTSEEKADLSIPFTDCIIISSLGVGWVLTHKQTGILMLCQMVQRKTFR